MLATERAAAIEDHRVLDGLLVRTASGDRAAFRSLYDQTAPRLFAICLRLGRNRALAEEFLQEGYARIWERAGQFDAARGSAWAWMIALVRNGAIDQIRAMRRDLAPETEGLEIADPLAVGGMETQVEMIGVLRCLAELDEGPRRAIILAYRDGLSYEELAGRLGIPVGTAKTWVSRGLARLRRALDQGS
jgi:RNA polymerase sigma-70 factor (ECF subfamily)